MSSSSKGSILQKKLFLMGSFLSLYAESPSEENLEEFYKSLSEEVNLYERKITTWNSNSEISKFNESINAWIAVDGSVYQTLKSARECAFITDEHFHPGLGRLIEMWGLRNSLKIPKKSDLKKIHKEIQATHLDFKSNKIRKSSKEWKFEEGGIAKGYVIDLIKERAKKFHIKKLRIQFSGQLYESDEQEVHIPSPINRNQIILSLKIKDSSISTTNNLNQHYVEDGKTYGHIINPKSGMLYPADSSSLIVVHRDGAMADCLSTGVFSLTKDEKTFTQWRRSHPEIQFLSIKFVNNKIIAFSSCDLSKKLTVLSKDIEIINNCI